MADVVEQPVPGQDPVQQTPPTPAAEPVASPPAPIPTSAPVAGPAPWQTDLEQSFQDPQVRAQVDAYLRSNIQPQMTRLEQTNAEARQMYDAFQSDPDAANIAVNRQLYGDEYGDQLAASINRPDQMVNAPAAVADVPTQQAPQEPAAVPPEIQQMYDEWSETRQQKQYDEAVEAFLTDPQYADIDRNLFDPFVSGAETWEDAVGNYRAYAAHFAANGSSNEQPPQPPPTIGSGAVGGPGTTAAVPHETLNEAIEGIFSENAPNPAPPTLGSQ